MSEAQRYLALFALTALLPLLPSCKQRSATREQPSADTQHNRTDQSTSPEPGGGTAPLDTEEPKLSFTVQLDQQRFPVREGQSVSLPGTFTNPKLSVSVADERNFSFAGVNFQYPRAFTFEADVSPATVTTWTLSGNDFKIMLFRFAAEISVDGMVKQLMTTYGAGASTTPTSLKLGTSEFSGTRIRAVLAGHTLIQDVLMLPPLKAQSRFLILQDNDTGSPEGQAAKALMSRTFNLGR